MAQEDFVTRVFLSEIETQCQFAHTGYSGIASTLQRLSSPESAQRPEPIEPALFYSVQMFLSSCANIAKLVWPKGKGPYDTKDQAQKRLLRGERIRKAIGIGTTNEPELLYLKSTRLRNYFEHFDERLDHWAANSTHHILMTRCSGIPESMMIANIGPAGTMGFFDQSTREVTFQDLTVSLPKLYAAVQYLYERIVANRPNWIRHENIPTPPEESQ